MKGLIVLAAFIALAGCAVQGVPHPRDGRACHLVGHSPLSEAWVDRHGVVCADF